MPTKDTNPVLSVRVVPEYKERWDKVGRLYKKPDCELPADFTALPVLRELIKENKLVPSITNVIGVRGSSYLVDWAAKLVATEAIRVAVKHPRQIIEREESALRYLKNIPHNEKVFWGTQGTNIHNACELLSLNQDISHLKLTDYEKACVEQYKRWLDEFQPNFNYVETTGFGTTDNNLGYAGTSDFHATINGVKILGDYKCTTDDTLILMRDGSVKEAKDIQIGDEVVSWSQEDNTMRTDKVTYAGDNGYQPTYTVVTELGQKLTITGNHKFLTRTQKGMEWRESETLKAGDSAYIALGWTHSPFRTETEWPHNKHLSPYLFGLLWALAHYNESEWTDSGKVRYPSDKARVELLDELANFGFLKSADDRIRVKTGLRRVANKARMEISELLDIINNPVLPDYVLSAPIIYQNAFMSGVQEVFANRANNADHFFVEHRTMTTLHQLQQLYFNNGLVAKLGMNPKTGNPVLRLPLQSGEQIHTFGLEEVKILGVKENPAPVHTIAIEVENTHNHVTNGVLTHNTNRSGIHADVALQLAANRNVDTITTDSVTLVEPEATDVTAALHLSPSNFTFQEVESGPWVYETFQNLRKVWDFHVFEGALNLKDNATVLGRKIRTNKEL